MSEKEIIKVVRASLPPMEEYFEEISDIWDSYWLTHTGPKHQKLEVNLCQYLQVPNVALFSNGHMALELALDALGVTGEVITTPFTFASTTQAIVRQGLTPVFCDINMDDYTMDVSKIEQLITEKTTAIMPVHVYGNICDYKAIDEIAKKYNLKVIYDAAHAFGVKVEGKGVGNLGDMSMFSFHATKVFNTVEGGGLTYADEKYNMEFRALRQFGMYGQDESDIIGTNAKMTEVHAAMGLCNLRHIDEEIAKRKIAVDRYMERLSNIEGVLLRKEQDGVQWNYAYFPVVFDETRFGKTRDEIMDKLAQHNIYARKYFYPLTSSFKAFVDKFPIQETPNAMWVSERVLTLPLYAGLSVADVDRICDLILEE